MYTHTPRCHDNPAQLTGLHLVQEFQHQANISSGFTCWRVDRHCEVFCK